MVKAIYPGSFDPPTYGHLNIIQRAASIFSELHVVVATNIHKSYLFDSQERFGLMQDIVQGLDNVKVHSWDSLIVEFARKLGIRILIRGVRAIADFGHEFELSLINRGLDSEIETLFMPTDPKYFVLRSSMIKELVLLKGDISQMVPKTVEKAMKDKLIGA